VRYITGKIVVSIDNQFNQAPTTCIGITWEIPVLAFVNWEALGMVTHFDDRTEGTFFFEDEQRKRLLR
jgi:hypothetical protein